MEELLSTKEQAILLDIARTAIVSHVRHSDVCVVPREERRLNIKRGCFVTIKQDGKLRGCIGNFQSEIPLFKEVSQMAVASSSNDPRFYPMKEEDLDKFSLEISVLSPLVKIAAPEDIQVGKHGIYMERSHYRGVLLPQVATENHWDRTTFLSQTCLKAGLPPEAWQDSDTDIYIFSAQVFGEEA
ncbi:AmmeMemoRadiSam system protein A [uncultured Desulfuromonas sp.]|uniref:AmmeMemoRadiSam system protein A n=1 Tax=uncultured Desulfuromonas sp. TaxID=181013 RepID=UPI002AAB8B23|nr:AmmeMemoRadiSam system protein A [uncultured Desulfuromonas sp.]